VVKIKAVRYAESAIISSSLVAMSPVVCATRGLSFLEHRDHPTQDDYGGFFFLNTSQQVRSKISF
jgi:hypothetical protein